MSKYRNTVYYDIKSRFLVIKISKYRTENFYFPVHRQILRSLPRLTSYVGKMEKGFT